MLYRNLTELIGKTPLLEIAGWEGQCARIAVKLEYFNPGGSVKDRIALAMIEEAETNGNLRPGGTIIEPTSGNTGVGLAWVGVSKGYKTILTMPDTMSQERRNLLKAFGARLELTPGKDGMKGAIARAEELRNRIPGAVILGQFDNPANPAIHERTTAEEIWADTEGQVDVFVAGVGTGGTACGTAKGLKQHKASIQAFVVEPAASRCSRREFPGRIKSKVSGPDSYPTPMIRPLWTASSRSPTRKRRQRLGCLPGRKDSWSAFLPGQLFMSPTPFPERRRMPAN